MTNDIVERLRTERDDARRERDDALVDLEVLSDELWERRTDSSEANERIQQLLGVSEQLRKERDEARRRYQIVLDFSHHLLTERAAARQCAKKETDNA